MKLITILLVAVAYVCATSEPIANEYGAEPYALEGKIRDMIEKLRQNFLAEGFDPLVLNKTALNLDLDKFKLKIDATGTGRIEGLLGFLLNKLKFSLPGLKIKEYELEFPKINVDLSEYNLKGMFDMLQLYGNGHLKVNVEGLKISGKGALGSKDKKMFIKVISINLSLQKFSFDVSGWANDEVRSKALSRLLTENIPLFVQNYQSELSKLLGDFIVSLGIQFDSPI